MHVNNKYENVFTFFFYFFVSWQRIYLIFVQIFFHLEKSFVVIGFFAKYIIVYERKRKPNKQYLSKNQMKHTNK